MLKRTFIASVVITILMSVTALATPPKTGCQKFNFTGTFLSPDLNVDIWGDGNTHSFAYQLTLGSDGTANQFWTGLPDYIINAGTGSPQIGSWTCRADGKLVVVLLQASYSPVTVAQEPLNLSSQDVRLIRHSRTTYLFSVDDENTLTKTQSRSRRYTPTQDPTDAAGGSLQAVNNQIVTYKRFTATDSDLP